jgi:hypothetical protein
MYQPSIHGLMAEFDTPEQVLQAAQKAYASGYRKMDAYSPFPVEGLADAIGARKTRVPLLVLLGALVGGIGGYFMMYYSAVIDYPINVGGRPLHSWPSFVPITFELTVLIAGLTAVVGMLFRNGLPRPYHPVFNVKRFEHASRDKFFLCIEATDAKFDRSATMRFLRNLDPHEVSVVEN